MSAILSPAFGVAWAEVIPKDMHSTCCRTLVLAGILLPAALTAADYDIASFGATTNGTPCQAAIQKAIDAAHAAGGGRVVVPAGTWMTGTIWVKSDVELHLSHGAVLKGSVNKADYNRDDAYPENFSCKEEEWSGAHLVIIHRAVNAAITGTGTIDGNGPAFFPKTPGSWGGWFYRDGIKLNTLDRSWHRPAQMVAVVASRKIRIRDVELANTTCWTLFLHGSEDVQIRGVRIFADQTLANSDGIDIDCCRNVTVSDCLIRSGDDGLTFRGCVNRLVDKKPCENIVVNNCDIQSFCYGVRVGVGEGIIRNITVGNCIFRECAVGLGITPRWIKDKGCDISDVRFHDCTLVDCAIGISDDGGKRTVFDGIRVESFCKAGGLCGADATVRDCTFVCLPGPKRVGLDPKGNKWIDSSTNGWWRGGADLSASSSTRFVGCRQEIPKDYPYVNAKRPAYSGPATTDCNFGSKK